MTINIPAKIAVKEANQLGMKNLFLWLGFILLIGVILGMVLKHYVF